MDSTQYADVWKDAAPDAFRQGGPVWLLSVLHTERGRDPTIERVRTHAAPPHSCTLYDFAADRLLTTCGRGITIVIGLYDETQRKLDELTVTKSGYGSIRLVRLTSRERWNIRVETGHEATYYADVDGKLVRVVTLDATYELWTRSDRGPTAEDALDELRARLEPNGDPGENEVAFVRAVDEDSDGFNERLDLTTFRFARVKGKLVVRSSPRAKRTLTWTPKTHTYEE